MAVNVLLDGASGVGKSVLVNRLTTGNYDFVRKTTWIDTYDHSVIIRNGKRYNAKIWDTPGQQKYSVSFIITYYGHADVIVEFFAIDDLPSLKEVLVRIPHIRKEYPKVPILLVGTKADLREANDEHLFPLELGPIVARSCGAVKYMECSSKANFNVREVFDEAVHTSLSKSNLEFIDEHLYAVMNMISDIEGEWADLWNFVPNPIPLFHVINPYFQQDLNLVEQIIVQIQSEIKKDSRKEAVIYRALDFDKLQLSYGLFGMVYNARESSPAPTCTLWCVHTCCKNPTQIVQCRLFSAGESHENVVCSKCPANLRFFANDCKAVASFLVSTTDQMKVRSLIIVNCYGMLDFSFLSKLTDVEYLIIVNTEVDLASLTFPPHLHETMKHLVLNNCGITQATDVPSEIGKLDNLEILNLVNNNFKKIPPTLGALEQLHTLLIDKDNVYFPPFRVLTNSTSDIINYLGAFREHPVANTESKLIVVGQEGVGKSTLVKAMRRSFWLTENEPPEKTDGVDISVLPLKDNIKCKVFDLAGDVEYLNTHSLFLSSNTLHLVVYDLSHIIVDKGARSADHLCRLELWLETIASQDPKSNVILVGTHADHLLVKREIIMKNRKLLAEVLIKYSSSHRTFCETDPCEECFICYPEKCPENLERLMTDTSSGEHSNTLNTTSSQIPHILGYFEVSSIKKYPTSLRFHNINVEGLKSLIASSISNMMKAIGTDEIPERWLLFRESIAQKLSSDEDLKQQPLMPLSLVYDIVFELEIVGKKNVVAMLRFFHSQGTYLWYEDLPAMKDIVILDPQWLSDQLRTLISHSPSVSSICKGVLHLSELSTVWPQMSDDNRRNLLTLFRSVGLCFSISDTEELFPCNLPVGWPDREIWPPLPKRGENQTSLLFKFSFVPPSFFSDLIVEVNKKNETFARNEKPLVRYYRFHIVYIRKDQRKSTSLNDMDAGAKGDTSTTEDDVDCLPMHHYSRVHYELMPYNNSLSVAVRGPDPPSIIPDIRSTIETVKRRHYPGVTYSESMLCPECVMKKIQPPASFKDDDHHSGVCSRGHIVGSNENIFSGKYILSSEIGQIRRDIVDTLKDHFCPKLFVVLPINLEGLSLKNRFVYSYIRDGYAVHLLCECPGQWHFVDSPGFRVGKPKEFFEKYGKRVCKALRYISTLSTPIKTAASLEPHCKIGAAVGAGAEAVSKDLKSLLDSYLDKYPRLKPQLGSSKDDLTSLKSSSGLQRSELSRFLEVEAKNRDFGPLVCTYVDSHNEWLWLCEEHYERFEIVQRENDND